MRSILVALALAVTVIAAQAQPGGSTLIPVTPDNFRRAETDGYFAGIGRWIVRGPTHAHPHAPHRLRTGQSWQGQPTRQEHDVVVPHPQTQPRGEPSSD
jgi:hypothetical protein